MQGSHYSSDHYQFGGSLPPDSPAYIVRKADFELRDALLSGTYCYVLNARQMGKSSLRVQTTEKLRSRGIACAEIELSGIGSQKITAQQWYGGIIQELVSGFGLRLNRKQWLQEFGDLSPVQRLANFIETELLEQIEENIVIFIDEIDSVLTLDFPTDEFFALIRNCFDRRSSKPEYRRLTFALLGVASPSDLIGNPMATPFNIGRAIDLKGFQLSECNPLEKGLSDKVSDPQVVLQQLLNWTNGQPFLTQKLCWLVATKCDFIPAGEESQAIARLVEGQIVENWIAQDEPEHLRTIRDRILRYSHSSLRLLKLYRRILRRGRIAFKPLPEHLELRLSGLVELDRGYLVVKNRIYQSVFDRDWVAKQIAGFSERKQVMSTRSGLLWGLMVASLVMGLRWMGILQEIELQAFDRLQRQLPYEPPDPRLLIVEADAEDIRKYGNPLSDAVIARLLVSLNHYSPHVIGLDIARDLPQPPGRDELINRLTYMDNVVPVCAFGGTDASSSEFLDPPPRVPIGKVGFSDLYRDGQSNDWALTVRRYLLSRTPNPIANESSTCTTPYSFALQLIYQYFEAEGVEVRVRDNEWVFGSVVTERLRSRSGGYQKLDARGNQLPIRFRNVADPQVIASRLTVRDVLEGSANFHRKVVEDRVVLIGRTDSPDRDWYVTPHGRMQGLYVHAHVVSQILSAVEDGRPLFWYFPWLVDGILVVICAVVGGVIFGSLNSMPQRLLVVGISVFTIYGVCWVALTKGGWLPLVPSALGLTASGAGLVVYSTYLKKDDE